MYQEALKARLPLVAVWTTDTINVADVIQHIVGDPKNVAMLSSPSVTQFNNLIKTHEYVVCLGEWEGSNYESLYGLCCSNQCCLVFVNPEKPHPLMFNAGQLGLPRILLKRFLGEVVENPEAYVPLFGGLTLKEVGEICRVTMTNAGGMVPQEIMKYRNAYMGNLKGLEFLNSELGFYNPPKDIKVWLNDYGWCFNTLNVPDELTPRGLLFDGPAGTGKTMGAKYVGKKLGMPVYRLDLTALLGKYVGESESNLQAALSKLQDAAPCVVLMDEVEKIFTECDESGVSLRLMSKLLWWLEEKRERILVLMTTNEVDDIPPELFREGRIDSVVRFKNLQTKEEVQELATGLAKQYLPPSPPLFVEQVVAEAGKEGEVSPARVAQIARQLMIKEYKNE